ncbi:MAG: cupin domain-containing protein [Proteobacteria bacterium]|nr:cupin domain-containing protein [Pseudomonadota bacterium]
MSAEKPALDPRTVEPESRSGYPPPYAARVLPREVRRLGERLGLTRIGVNLTTLLPGKESSMRHWHTHEDEFVYVLEGEAVLRTDAGEQPLRAGMCAGFPAGSSDGHQLINRSARPVVYLVVSNRDAEDTGSYSDADVDLVYSPPHARRRFTRRDGTPW